MKPDLFPSQLAALKLAMAACKVSFKTLKRENNLLTKNELRAAEIYLRTQSYKKAALQMQTEPIMIFIYIKNVISTLHIYGGIKRTESRK